MILQENLILTGNWLFRWRSYIPLIMITIYIPALNEYEFLYSKREYTTILNRHFGNSFPNRDLYLILF